MKKLLVVLFLSLTFLVGCDNMINSPTSVVEDFFSKYQKLDKEVLEELEKTIDKDKNMNNEQKKEYKERLQRQYQNLSYKITNEEVFDGSAIVDVEIEVLDYATTIYKAKKYYQEHPEEFDTENSDDKNIDKEKKYIDYKLKKLKEVNDKNKYEITLNLTKKEGVWKLDELNDSDKQKIHGLY